MRKVDIGSYDLNLLRCLQMLIELRHVSHAADRCGMSQPAMSRTLARLRRDFGDPLLVRAGGGLRRTSRAEALIEPLQAALEQLNRLYHGSNFVPATATRVFRAAIPDALFGSLSVPLIPTMVQEAPGCSIEIVPWPRFHEPVLMSLDFAVGTDFEPFPGFRAAPLFEDRDLLAVRKHDSAAFAKADAKAMLIAPHVAIVASGMSVDPVDRWLSSLGHERNIKAVVPHYLQALLLVAQSDFVSILPSRLIASYCDTFDIVGIELPIAQEADRYHLFHPVERDSDPANRWVRDLIRRVVNA